MRIKTLALKGRYDFPDEIHGTLCTADLSRADSEAGLMERVRRLGYDRVRVPVDSTLLDKERATIQDLKAKAGQVEALTCLSYLRDDILLNYVLSTFNGLEVFIDPSDPGGLEFSKYLIESARQRRVDLYFSLAVTKPVSRQKKVKEYFEALSKIHLYFPYRKGLKSALSNRGAYKFLMKLKSLGLSDKIGAPREVLFDSRRVMDTKEEYFWEARLDSTLAVAPTYSVIIPCYNNYDYLKKTLTHLKRQQEGFRNFEVLIIDDGSDSKEVSSFSQWVREFISCGSQLKYIYSPRFTPRTMGDGRYRAGVSRNLGVAHARGEILCFLDSDILVPPDYFQQVSCALEKHDVVQFRRYDLSRRASEAKIGYSEILDSDLLYEDPYWDNFNANPKDWSDRAGGWKYTCTHSLSLRAEVFKKSGWILPCFIYYGFEDTELGYRLWNQGLKFGLGGSRVYHLYHKPDRSEYLRERWKRDKILSKTAEIFFRHRPDAEVYQMFQSYLR